MPHQIFCVASWLGVPSVAPCKQRDVHFDTCQNEGCPGERAYRSHEIEERPHRIRRVRCPECQQQTIWRPPAWCEGHVIVKSSNDECRHVLSQDEYEELEKAS